MQPIATEKRRLRYEANPAQIRVLTSDKPIIFLGAGVGYGKTETGALWTLNRVNSYPVDDRGPDASPWFMIAANSYPQVYDSTLAGAYALWHRLGCHLSPDNVPKGYGPTNIYLEGRCIKVRSMNNYQDISGMQIADYWLDEVWQTPREAWNVTQARARDRRVEQNRGLLTTTLDDPDSWMYEVFAGEGYDPERMEVLYAGTSENAANLPVDYIDNMRATYSKRQFQRMVGDPLPRWVSLETGLIYHAFGPHNVSPEADYDEALPLLWMLDFNIADGAPMSSCIGHLRNGRFEERLRPELHIVDEIVIETADTHDAINEFEARGYDKDKAAVKIYGDAAGKARDTRSKKTDYQILAERGYIAQDVPSANPPIRDRHNTVNAALKNAAGDVRVKIHPRCKTLIKGLETTRLKGGAQYIEEVTKFQHITTALGYGIMRLLPMQQPVRIGPRLVKLKAR